MKQDNLKKDSDITAFDELTDEQLEAVLGGIRNRWKYIYDHVRSIKLEV